MTIEKKLTNLFDFQKYEKNEKLDKIISEDAEYMEALSDDDLEYLAAGTSVDRVHKDMIDKLSVSRSH